MTEGLLCPPNHRRRQCHAVISQCPNYSGLNRTQHLKVLLRRRSTARRRLGLRKLGSCCR